MKPRLRVWLRDELTRVVRSELTETSAALEHKLDTGLTELHQELASERATSLERDSAHDATLAGAISQLADAINSLQHRLDADIDERALHLSSVEWLMRELIIGFPQPIDNPMQLGSDTSVTVLGGTIEIEAVGTADVVASSRDTDRALNASEEIDLREAERTVGMMVEVRSRFHDRWIRGFQIREIVDVQGLRRFRLTRISDHMALPVLFDSGDIRPLPIQPDIEPAEHSV